MEGQLSLFEFMESQNSIVTPALCGKLLSVGDRIGRVVLGECRVATITEVEGLPKYPFYRTDSGVCYSVDEGQTPIGELQKIAEEQRKKYKTLIPSGLTEKITVEYEPRKCDGKVLWAQIGILGNMLFWKESCTYQFLEPYDSEKKLKQAYNEHKKRILDDTYNRFKISEDEHVMRRLYWSNHGFFADAEYVMVNG